MKNACVAAVSGFLFMVSVMGLTACQSGVGGGPGAAGATNSASSDEAQGCGTGKGWTGGSVVAEPVKK